MRSADRWAGLGLALAVLGAAGPALAALGAPETSVERDRAKLAMVRAAPRGATGSTVHELRGATQAVREFVGPAGKVYAVAWSGIAPPDLPLLLGEYHAEYRAAASRLATARGPRRVESDRIVVETWGHGRSLHGRAWVKSLVPPEASLDDVQ